MISPCLILVNTSLHRFLRLSLYLAMKVEMTSVVSMDNIQFE